MKYFFTNFKMFFSISQMQQFMRQYKHDLCELSELRDVQIGMFPSYEQLYFLQQELQESNVELGAQNCSIASVGAYTGQVSVSSLFDLQVAYCLVGHSEVRLHLSERQDQLTQKVKMLLASNITPIVCIGETLQEKNEGYTLQVLFDQIESILQVLMQYPGATIFIAYEPVYAIGSGMTPSLHELQNIFTFLKKLTIDAGFAKNVLFLYGGSVSGNSVHMLNQIDNIDGYLIGSASRDFQELKKIVLSDYKILEKDQQKRLQMRN